MGNIIHSDAEVLLGKPVVKGTRLSVEFLLGLFAAGWNEKQVSACTSSKPMWLCYRDSIIQEHWN